MSRPKPTVKRAYVRQDNDGIAYVVFTDGHELVVHEHFVPMVARTHQLEAVWLRRGDTHIATFHPRRQYPVNRTPIGFARLAAGWTPQRFAEYWTAAVDYAKAAQKQGKLERVWSVLRLGWEDLDEVTAGKWPAPAPSAPAPPRRMDRHWRRS